MQARSTLSRLRWLAVPAVVAPLLACQPDADPAGPNGRLLASRNGVPSTESLASPAWQGTAGTLVAQARILPCAAGRLYAFVGVAQYLAVQRAEAAVGGTDAADFVSSPDGIGRGGRSRLETDRGAVAGASAVVLAYLFPGQAQALEAMVTAQANAGPGQPHPAFAAGEAIGRAVGAEIVTRAQTDGWDHAFTGTIPTGDGFWKSNTDPATVACGQLPGVRPWFLTSASQFRSAPPPAFGPDPLSPFQVAQAEILDIALHRTQAQIDLATFWAQSTGTPTTPGIWLQRATAGITEHGLSERQATHLYALVSATMADAQVGCWDTKETFWFIRPWQANPAITVVAAVGKPNHPSYPSGHSCTSASAAEVLSTFFPEQRAELDAMVIAAGLSRMYGGIHYRFDIDAGQLLGRSVAGWAIAADASGHSVLTP